MAKRAPPGLAGVSLAGLLAACQMTSAPPSPPPVAPAASAAAVAARAWPLIDWAKAPDCQAKLGLLADAVRAGRLNADEHPPIAVVRPGSADGRDWLSPPSVTVAADLPLEVHERTDPAIVQTPCLLLVAPARDQRVGQRLISQDSVRSLYQSGERAERNPDYDAAQLRLRQAEHAAKNDGPGILRVGDPMLDLFGMLVGGVISGFSQGSREREVDQATTALAAIPRSIDRPVYQPYQFERQNVLAGKEAIIPVALLDRANGRVWRADLRQRERREFEILEGLDPRDKDHDAYAAGSLTPDDFEHWQREPPRLQLSAIAAALRDAAPAPAPAPDQLIAALAQSAPPTFAGEPLPSAAVFAPARDQVPTRRHVRAGRPSSDAVRPDGRSARPGGLDGPLAETDAGGDLLAQTVAGDEALATPRADQTRSALPARGEPWRERTGRLASLGFDGPPGAAPRQPAADLGLAPGAGPAASPGPDPRAASVVRVGSGRRGGGGVYVRSDLVLTTARLVDGSSVVDVATADGTQVLGLVARADRARNLALVQVAHPGPPVAFYDGPPLQPGQPVEAIALAEGAGVVLTPGRYQNAHAVAGVAGPAPAGLAKVEVGVPPVRPEGLPWFLGDHVVGVGSGDPDPLAQGSLIALRASEVLDFLYGAGGALAKVP